MIGDLILTICRFLKQTFCIHDYKWKGKLDWRYEECTKCGKLK